MKLSNSLLKHITILGGALICIVICISCKNFMNAASVKREIEEAIEIANSNPVTYYVTADKASGTVTPEQLRLKKKETFEIKFIPADYWSFLGWEVLDRTTGEPVTNSLLFEDSTNIEAKGKVIEPRENLEIHAKCVQIPCITGYYPPDYPTGIEQDSTIKIFFNKPVNPQSFGNFSCITITTPNGSVDDYYEAPYFSDDNKTLNILSAKGKYILSSDTFADITISIDLSNIIDEEGIQMSGQQSYTFRINKNTDTKIPEFTKTDLYSTNDTTNNFYRQLTDKVLTQWNDSPITGYTFGDVSKNHCFSSVYYDFDGYDLQTGLAGIKISEQLIKNTDGTGITGQVFYTDYSSLNDIYTFKTDKDGILKLDFQLVDYAGNKTAPKTYYVIKDSKSHLKVYNKLPEPVNNKYAITGDNGVNEVLKKMYVEFNDTFATINGKVYKHTLDDSDIQIFTKTDYNSDYSKVSNYNYVTTETENPYIWFTFNEFSDTSNSYIKVIVTTPETIKEREFEVPKTPKVIAIDPGSGSWYSATQTGNFTFNLKYDLYSENFNLAEALKYCIFSYWSNSSPETNPVNSSDPIFTYGENESVYGTCLTPEISFNNLTYTTIYSGILVSYDIYEKEPYTIYSLQGSLPYFKNYEVYFYRKHGTKNTSLVKKPVLSITAEPGPKSSGRYIIHSQVSNLDSDANISFQVIKKEWGHNWELNWSDREDRTFEVYSSYATDMEIRVRAIRLVNGLLYYNDSEWQEFTIDVDNCSPSITDHSTDYSYDSKKLTNISDLVDSGYNAGLLYDENNNHNIKYWIIPFNQEVYNKQKEKLTKDYVNSFHPREHVLSLSKSLIEDDEGDWEYFDISNLTDGEYMLVAENWDKNGNCNFEIVWSFEVGSLTKPLNISRNNSTFTITAPNETISEAQEIYEKRVFKEYFDSTKNRWIEESWSETKKIPETDDLTYTITPDSNNFIKIYKAFEFSNSDGIQAHRVTYPQYIWTGSNSTCLVKEICYISDEVAVIRCDNACVLETAVCSVNYNDPHKWDLYATKKKPQMITSSDFYCMDTSNIYQGDYYCIIAHFADGTIRMSDVKQKE